MIKINELTKQYDGFTLNISLELTKGRVTGLVGRNGAGKSTAIKAILGLVRPDAGSVLVFDKEAGELRGSDKARIGAAFIESGFSGYLTVGAVAVILGHMYPAFDRSFFLTRAEAFRLPLNKPIKEFSTGMKARLRVLTALSHNAELLILDEPTAGLDVLARNEILALLKDYMAENAERSMLITSHISDDLAGLCDDICIIDDGKVLLHEDMAALKENYALFKVTEEERAALDGKYLLRVRKTEEGYACLTDNKCFYAEKYPNKVMEDATIDELLLMLVSEQEGRK